MKNWKNIIIKMAGIGACLFAAFLMAFGEPIVGPDHTGVATVVLIIGIGTITAANTTSLLGTKKEGK